MIPILSATQIKYIDQYTIENEPISSIDLMERAVDALLPHFSSMRDSNFHIICGNGNNGGDGLALARKLWHLNSNVRVSLIAFSDRISPDCKEQLRRLTKETSIVLNKLKTTDHLNIKSNEIIIDAIFGNGLNKILSGDYLRLIQKINRAHVSVYSIDMPSGLKSDGITPISKFIQAKKTFVLEIPRMSLFNPDYLIDFVIVPIGLHPKGVASQKTKNWLITEEYAFLPQRIRHSHKNNYGHSLIIGGSSGMWGAPILSSKAAFKIGSGLVTCAIPNQGLAYLHHHLLEAMSLTSGETHWNNINFDVKKYQSICIGPGIGQHPETFNALKNLLQSQPSNIVIDADALNLLAQNQAQDLIPKNAIITPHPGEFKRLFGTWKNEKERLKLLKTSAKKHRCIIVLKGTYTVIATPNGALYFNSQGSASLATAGSGDVLAGLITGLMAQGMEPLQAAISGVFHHGKAGNKLQGKPILSSEILNYI